MTEDTAYGPPEQRIREMQDNAARRYAEAVERLKICIWNMMQVTTALDWTVEQQRHNAAPLHLGHLTVNINNAQRYLAEAWEATTDPALMPPEPPAPF